MNLLRSVLFAILPLITVQSQSLKLEEIVVFGNSRTRAHVIVRELRSGEGGLYSETMLQKDRAWLLRQDFLKRIDFQVKPGSFQDSRILLVIVQEKGMWSVSPILTNKDIFGWYAGARITARNLWGRRNTVTTTIQLGSIQHFGLSFQNPWFGGRLKLFTELDVYHKSFRYVFRDVVSEFDERDLGAIWTLGKTIGRRFQIGIQSGIERVWVENAAMSLSGTQTDNLFILEPFIRLDSRDWPLYPRTGIYIESWMRWFAPFQGHRFQRLGIDFRVYTPAHHGNIIAIQGFVQLSQGTIPVYKRIHMGGGHILRGYRTDALAGENSLLVSAEYRFPILYERNPLAGIHAGYAGVLFIDLGSAWFQDESFSPRLLRASAGFGIHLIWDHFVLRAEYGHRGKGWGFINLGTGIKF